MRSESLLATKTPSRSLPSTRTSRPELEQVRHGARVDHRHARCTGDVPDPEPQPVRVRVPGGRAGHFADERDLALPAVQLARLDRRRAAGNRHVEQEDREHGGDRERDDEPNRAWTSHGQSLARSRTAPYREQEVSHGLENPQARDVRSTARKVGRPARGRLERPCSVAFSSSSHRYKPRKTTIANGIEPGPSITPPASCWSFSAVRPPGRCGSAA